MKRLPEEAVVHAEQRAHPRVSANFPLEFHIGPGPAGAAAAVNISVGGLMMHSAQEVAVGTTLALRFRLTQSDGQELTVRSRVVARQRAADGAFHYNLAFFGVDSAVRSRIAEFVAAAA